MMGTDWARGQHQEGCPPRVPPRGSPRALTGVITVSDSMWALLWAQNTRSAFGEEGASPGPTREGRGACVRFCVCLSLCVQLCISCTRICRCFYVYVLVSMCTVFVHICECVCVGTSVCV